MRKNIFSRIKDKSRGQSLVELMLIVPALGLMLAGVVELGLLMNNYLKVLDGSREAARLMSSSVAYDPNPYDPITHQGCGGDCQLFYVNTAIEALNVMLPISLNGNRGDDILISVFSIAQGRTDYVRFPLGYVHGWSLCQNYGDATLRTNLQLIDPTLSLYNAFISGWDHCTIHTSQFTSIYEAGYIPIQAHMDASAPSTGALVVEIYYNYPQTLGLPIISQYLPNPIHVYTYSVMPISSAEPTPTAHP